MTSLDELAELLPAPGSVATDPAIMARYMHDESFAMTAGQPLAVVRPATTADVCKVVGWCSNRGVPIIPRGAGTGLSGGATSVEGAVTLSTERMRSIEIDRSLRVAVAQPGALNAHVKAAAAKHGLWYPPDPSSYEICTIGGNIATNAGGLCCVKYGVTSDFVLAMEVVLAGGEAVRLGGPRLKDVAGLSLTKLFVGSEGTLGIITEATLRLLPPRPNVSTLVATFASLRSACEAVLEGTQTLRPAMMEFMDSVSINAVEDELRMGLDRSAAAMLVAQLDSGLKDETKPLADAFMRSGASDVYATDDPAEGEAFTAARRMALPAMEKLGSLLLEDVGVPLSQLPALVEGVHAIASRTKLTIAIIAHAGDGNTHPLIVYDAADPVETRRAHDAFAEIMNLATSLDGTITGEHGVGQLKAPWLKNQIGTAAMALNERIKTALDPTGIFSPATMFTPRGEATGRQPRDN